MRNTNTNMTLTAPAAAMLRTQYLARRGAASTAEAVTGLNVMTEMTVATLRNRVAAIRAEIASVQRIELAADATRAYDATRTFNRTFDASHLEGLVAA